MAAQVVQEAAGGGDGVGAAAEGLRGGVGRGPGHAGHDRGGVGHRVAGFLGDAGAGRDVRAESGRVSGLAGLRGDADLLPSALHILENAVPPGIRTHLQTHLADLDGFEFEAPADLILAFSAIEHLRDLEAVRSLLDRVRAATRPGGVVAIGIAADRVAIDCDRDRC